MASNSATAGSRSTARETSVQGASAYVAVSSVKYGAALAYSATRRGVAKSEETSAAPYFCLNQSMRQKLDHLLQSSYPDAENSGRGSVVNSSKIPSFCASRMIAKSDWDRGCPGLLVLIR